jgi:hypothetical protein
MGMVDASQKYGGLQRQLNTQNLQDKYNDYLRTRTEKQNQVSNMLNSMYNNANGVDWGVQKYSTRDPGFLGNITNGMSQKIGEGLGSFVTGKMRM